MKKAPKEAYGIYQDGKIIRMVHLRKEGAETYLLGMDSIQLEQDWYKSDQVITGSPNSDFIPLDSHFTDVEDLDMNEFAEEGGHPDTQPKMEVSPLTMMLSKFPMQQGVIALNVHEQHILKDEPGRIKRKEISSFRKKNLSHNQIKAGEWKSCILNSEGNTQHWLYTGPNLLLDAIKDYSKESGLRLYYLLADANDIVLTDYYRFLYSTNQVGITLLVYLGHEFRKIYVFQDGQWTSTLPVHITQQFPEADIIYSKIALALDSAQLGEPEQIILAGDLANRQLAAYMNAQSMSTKTSLLEFPNLVLTDSDSVEYADQILAPYSLALALAYKALNIENDAFTKCTFLPARIIDSQKEFRVVWHGFVILSLLFGLALYTTIQYQQTQLNIRQEEQKKTDLNFTLNRLRAENAIVEQLSQDIAKLKENTDKVGKKLEGKNRWTELFDVLNSTFSSYQQSWISNLRHSNGQISITGITSDREHVSRLAANLPASKIRRVTNSKIRDRVVWNFEMDFTLPELDWVEIISKEYMPITRSTTASSRPNRGKVKIQPQTQEQLEQAISYKFGVLPRIEQQNVPLFDESSSNCDPEALQLYRDFSKAINKGNMLEYRFIGHSLIQNYPDCDLIPLTRWWLAYRLYLDREFSLAEDILNPNLQTKDKYLPYNLLLKARLDYVAGNRRFLQTYESLIMDYPESAAARQAELDLAFIERGAVR
nr:hypothetical protein [Candidatus Cloacimonadota bacterium]